MNPLNFIATETIEQFKEEQHIDIIKVKQNSATGKLFMVYDGVKTGAVSSKGLPEHPIISLVNATLDRIPTEEESRFIGRTAHINGQNVADPRANGFFYLLHEEALGGGLAVAEF